MNFPVDILDTTRLTLTGTFDNQVSFLLKYVRLSREEADSLNALFYDLHNCLQELWRGCEVIPFGSVVTGLGIKTSDVDCYVRIPGRVNRMSKPVNGAKKILLRHSDKFTQIFTIPMAKVPIVKFKHIPTNRDCDVNFTSLAGVENSRLIAFLLNLDRRAMQLAVLIKYWSKVHAFTGTNLLANYTMTLLVIFFLQHVEIIPSVKALQGDGIKIVEGWNTFFDNTAKTWNDNAPLFMLMGDFFRYYANFDFESQIISPFLGRAIKRDTFRDLSTVPDDFAMYKDNIRNKTCRPLRIDAMMCVQDPFDHSRNCAVSVFPKLAAKILHKFRTAAKMHMELGLDRFLGGILTKEPGDEVLPIVLNQRMPQQARPGRVTKQARKIHQFYRNRIHNMYNQVRQGKK